MGMMVVFTLIYLGRCSVGMQSRLWVGASSTTNSIGRSKIRGARAGARAVSLKLSVGMMTWIPALPLQVDMPVCRVQLLLRQLHRLLQTLAMILSPIAAITAKASARK